MNYPALQAGKHAAEHPHKSTPMVEALARAYRRAIKQPTTSRPSNTPSCPSRQANAFKGA